jgi:hypothetical protein
MSSWDDDGPQLQANLAQVLTYARDHARRRAKPALSDALSWHRDMMRGLTIPPKTCAGYPPENLVGRFRGMRGLEIYDVGIGDKACVGSHSVADALLSFQDELQRRVGALDALIGPEATEQDLSANQLREILTLCAWAHCEWIRIHPFANGNGRTARIWANYLAMRYALPPFVQLRPRPGREYEAASAAAMDGHWRETFRVFLRMYQDYDG